MRKTYSSRSARYRGSTSGISASRLSLAWPDAGFEPRRRFLRIGGAFVGFLARPARRIYGFPFGLARAFQLRSHLRQPVADAGDSGLFDRGFQLGVPDAQHRESLLRSGDAFTGFLFRRAPLLQPVAGALHRREARE